MLSAYVSYKRFHFIWPGPQCIWPCIRGDIYYSDVALRNLRYMTTSGSGRWRLKLRQMLKFGNRFCSPSYRI